MIHAANANRRWASLVFAALFLSFAYFYQGAGPNQNSRFDLTRAIVEQRTFRIDQYAANTFDKSEADGHYYSDKAPGLSFAATPVYVGVRAAQLFRAPTRESERNALYALTVVVVGGLSALGGASLFSLLRRLGLGLVASLAATFAWGLGSNTFAYATLFVAHSFVGALLILAFSLLQEASSRGSPTARGVAKATAFAGLTAGWAAISEYPAGVLGLLLFLYGSKRLGVRAMIPFAVTSLLPLVLLGSYNASCFGSPFTLGYQRLAAPEFQGVIQQGFFGISLPSVSVLNELLVGEFRGILPLSPWMFLALPGFVLFFRTPKLRAEAALTGASVTFVVLLNAAYARWDGGAAMGPRYMVPAFPFVAVATAFALDAIGRLERPFRAAASAISASLVAFAVLVCLACVAVMPEFPDVAIASPTEGMRAPDPKRPITTLVIPLFFRGALSVKATTPDGRMGPVVGLAGHENDAFNVGERLGLAGLGSLIPLALLWLATGLVFGVSRFRSRRSQTGDLTGT